MIPPPRTRRGSSDLAKALAEMCLIQETARERNLTQAFACRHHQRLRSLDPGSDNVSMWRVTEAILKAPGEVADAERNDFRQIGNQNGSFKPIFDVGLDLALLPRCQSAPSRTGLLMEFARENGSQAPSRFGCGIQIMVQCRPHIFKQSIHFDRQEIPGVQ